MVAFSQNHQLCAEVCACACACVCVCVCVCVCAFSDAVGPALSLELPQKGTGVCARVCVCVCVLMPESESVSYCAGGVVPVATGGTSHLQCLDWEMDSPAVRVFADVDSVFSPGPHRVRQRTRTPRSQRTKMGLTNVHGCVHTDMHVRHHDRGWVPTPNVRWRMVRNVVKAVHDALAHAV